MATAERIVIESMFNVADKDGNDVHFRLNPAQIAIDNRLTGRDIIPKARQEGVSTLFLARATVKCLGQRNTRAVVISHDEKSTQRMLQKVHYFLEELRGPKAVIKNASKNEITFPKTNSAFYVGTAGAKKFGRGDTITNLHCSEVAYWPDPKGLTAGLFQAVPRSGEISIESTGNGAGNWYHKMCERAYSGQGRYRLHFLDWQSFPEYCVDVSDAEALDVMANLNPDYDEPEIVKQFNLSAGQVVWRREKLEELDFDMRLFRQEYPSSLDECFQAGGHSLFTKVRYVDVGKFWERHSPGLHILKGHPYPTGRYAFGVDPSGGVGLDNASICIIDLDRMEQVGEFASNKVPPDMLADKLNTLGRWFNNAFLTVESNNHGLVTLKCLLDVYPRYLLYRGINQSKDILTMYGHPTTAKTKALMIGKARSEVLKNITIHSPLLTSEMSTFVETDEGKLEADGACLDDRVIAFAKCVWGMDRAQMAVDSGKGDILITRDNNPFALAAMIEELQGRGRRFPIAPQAGSDEDIGCLI